MHGGEVSEANSKPALQDGKPSTIEQTQHASSTLQVDSNPSKTNDRALPTRDQSSGLEPALIIGALPPLNIRGDSSKEPFQRQTSPRGGRRSAPSLVKESQESQSRSLSLKGAGLAVVSAETLQKYRRSSAAMHIDLLRVFVPDMLINVRFKGVLYHQ